MFKGTLTNATVSANTNVPITAELNTNNKVRVNDNAIEILARGLWKVDSNIGFTASATATTVNLLINGVVRKSVTLTTENASAYQVSLSDVELIKYTSGNDFVDFAIQFSTNVTNVSGGIFAEYMS